MRALDRAIVLAALLSRLLLTGLWVVLGLAVLGAVVVMYANGANPW